MEDEIGSLDDVVEAAFDEVVGLVQRDLARKCLSELQEVLDLVGLAGGPHGASHGVALFKKLLDKLRCNISARTDNLEMLCRQLACVRTRIWVNVDHKISLAISTSNSPIAGNERAACQ